MQYCPLFHLDATERYTPISCSFPACFHYAPAVKSALLPFINEVGTRSSLLLKLGGGEEQGCATPALHVSCQDTIISVARLL